MSLGSSCFPPSVSFLQELPSYQSVARRRTNIISRDKQSSTLLKPTDSYSSQLDGGITENLNSQSIRKYALNISEKRRLRFVQELPGSGRAAGWERDACGVFAKCGTENSFWSEHP